MNCSTGCTWTIAWWSTAPSTAMCATCAASWPTPAWKASRSVRCTAWATATSRDRVRRAMPGGRSVFDLRYSRERSTSTNHDCMDDIHPIAPDKRAAILSTRSEEHTSELQSQSNLVCRLLLEKKKTNKIQHNHSKREKQPLHAKDTETVHT